MTSEFSSEIMEARKHRITFLKYWNNNNNNKKKNKNHPQTLHPGKNILEWRWIEAFSDKTIQNLNVWHLNELISFKLINVYYIKAWLYYF